MRILSLALLVALTACSSEAESLERQYEMVSGKIEKCELATETRDAWLREENRQNYERWRGKAMADCFSARFP